MVVDVLVLVVEVDVDSVVVVAGVVVVVVSGVVVVLIVVGSVEDVVMGFSVVVVFELLLLGTSVSAARMTDMGPAQCCKEYKQRTKKETI